MEKQGAMHDNFDFGENQFVMPENFYERVLEMEH